MANDGTSYARPDADGDSHAEPNREQARQGQNVRGMLTVLVVSIAAIAIIFAIIIGLSSGGQRTDPSPQADLNSETNPAVADPVMTQGPPEPSDRGAQSNQTPQRTERGESTETVPDR